ncbi:MULTISPECIES: 50S ribosomal protein L25/general stress protein Ctc [Asaia]|uniref:Large ribosomal subunit protein bL25 n=2 Tax=Asaia bogorensis TaxID=91915 RepID=A0A060QI23_9PROT|nr:MULTISPECIES: 50S ribosomal protein L25/general stress protein Ctc [Asaia]NIE80426.1 50S ribosomal protein L25/general stress protein Ctc [Asaia sp. As-1742]ETC98361.1 50S ribosomal protein L25 [Asaia sp. SF2.1]MDL2170951.1 50S ribosomal protein L25/general stress protein Ctc [Asaia sp. HumB]MDR6183371.1 large subunit ribosomal protein L25 [Asaia bogorensis NBRC 16594]CDG40794.1 LSU ribosomal protein L25p [Asaia bogorensis]
MTNMTSLEVSTRAKAGKGAARATRRAGLVPGVVYGGKQEASLIQIDPRIIHKEMVRGGWRSRLYELPLEGGTVRALLREVQLHPVTDAPIHVDFQRLAAGEKVHVTVAIHVTGEDKAPGIKRGGVLNLVRHTVDVMADVDNIPSSFTVDLSALDIHDNVRWDDLTGTENVTPVLQLPNFVIATIAPPTVDAEMEAEAAAKAAAEAAAPAKKK